MSGFLVFLTPDGFRIIQAGGIAMPMEPIPVPLGNLLEILTTILTPMDIWLLDGCRIIPNGII